MRKSYNAPVRIPRKRRKPPYNSLKNIHLDVHGLRKDIREAIEKSQTAIMNQLSLISSKIDGIGGGGGDGEVVTEADKTLAREIRDAASAIMATVNAIDDQTPSAAEPGV